MKEIQTVDAVNEARQAVESGAHIIVVRGYQAKFMPDLIIGGEATCREAEKMGYPTLFYDSTEESIAEALQAAKKMAYAAEAEKQNTAQFETVLDTSFNGIIKINVEGKVIVINKLVENLIGKNAEDVIGLPVADIFPEFDISAVESILLGRRENYTVSVNIRNNAWLCRADDFPAYLHGKSRDEAGT